MTPDKFKHEMKKIADMAEGDTEAAHAEADKLMVRALKMSGYVYGAEIFEKIKKWYA
ncbi:MAG TPA: hypothetical protein VJN64_11895 [Terriglobales bacterium]|nr:hypothetical protein [Terriglobales bacterium]